VGARGGAGGRWVWLDEITLDAEGLYLVECGKWGLKAELCCKLLGKLQDYRTDLEILTTSSKHCLPAPSQDEDTPPTLVLPSTDIGIAGLGRAKGVMSISLACNLGQ